MLFISMMHGQANIRQWFICDNTIDFNRQVISALKILVCFEGTAVGLKLPEDGVINTETSRIEI